MSDNTRAHVLLLSGGMDSAALAVLLRPKYTLFINYGQSPALAERRAARAIAAQLHLDHHELQVDLRRLGAGVLAGLPAEPGAPSPEWWPYRNQLLATLAAAWTFGLRKSSDAGSAGFTINLGSVRPDGLRHADGRTAFYRALDELLNLQEGNVGADAPALSMTTQELIRRSDIGDDVLAWTHSCHRADIPCNECPGCYKRAEILLSLGRLA